MKSLRLRPYRRSDRPKVIVLSLAVLCSMIFTASQIIGFVTPGAASAAVAPLVIGDLPELPAPQSEAKPLIRPSAPLLSGRVNPFRTVLTSTSDPAEGTDLPGAAPVEGWAPMAPMPVAVSGPIAGIAPATPRPSAPAAPPLQVRGIVAGKGAPAVAVVRVGAREMVLREGDGFGNRRYRVLAIRENEVVIRETSGRRLRLRVGG